MDPRATARGRTGTTDRMPRPGYPGRGFYEHSAQGASAVNRAGFRP